MRDRRGSTHHRWLYRLGVVAVCVGAIGFAVPVVRDVTQERQLHQAQSAFDEAFTDTTSPSPPSAPASSVASSTPPTVPVPGRDLSPALPVDVRPGDPVARLEIPSIGVRYYVVAGVDDEQLDVGPGHYPGTVHPGQLGNMAIAGHRTTHGAPFRALDELVPGDEVHVTDLWGRTFRYEVTDRFVVDPSDTWVVATVHSDRATVTFTTCHPEGSNRQRLVVVAELDASFTGPVDESAFRYVAAPTTPRSVVGGDGS